MRLALVVGIAVVILCLMDVLTTEYVITSGIGYESNEILAPVLGFPIYILKLALPALTVLAIAKADMDARLKFASYSTLIAFYTLVVVNNILVIVHNVDLNLNLGKLLMLFTAIFTVNVVASTITNPQLKF